MQMIIRKLSYLLIAILASLFAIPSLAQKSGDEVQVRLSLAGGKSVYKTGEPIRLALSFTSDADGYRLNITTTKPASPVDEILLTPDEGVSHWLDEYSGKHWSAPDHMSMRNLTTTPAIVELTLNDLFRFDRPGKYTAQVKTRRVSRPERPHDHGPVINLTSNEVSFEVVAMSKAEAEQEVRRLSALVDATRDRKEEARISEELSYLPGEASTREKARRFIASQGAAGDDTKTNIQRMTQVNLIEALMVGKAWKLSEEKINQLKQSCVTQACRQRFDVQQEVRK